MKGEKIQVKKIIITDLNEILSKHVPLQYWDKIKSEISPRYKSPVAVLIEIPDEDVKNGTRESKNGLRQPNSGMMDILQ